jgi:RHS repeat-associated protein
MESHDGTWSYGYDAIGQLTSANFVSTNPLIADKSLVYEYDTAGNRTRVIEDGVETLYTANALNQYTQVGDTTFAYDDDGNMVSKADPSGTTTYAYDLNNRLVRVIEADGSVHEHEYDVLGNRVSTTTDGVRTEFFVDPFGFGNVVGDYASDGTRGAEYIHGLNLAYAEIDGIIGYYDVDGIGSVGALTTSDGSIVNRYQYDPYGISLLEYEGLNNKYEYVGAYGVYEDVDGSIAMRARNYEVQLGGFRSEDPLWLSGDIQNFYRYAANGPTLYSDPEGLRVYTAGVAGSIFLGVGIGGGGGIYYDEESGDYGIYLSGRAGSGLSVAVGGEAVITQVPMV